MKNQEITVDLKNEILAFFIEFPIFFVDVMLKAPNREWLEKYLINRSIAKNDNTNWCKMISENELIEWTEDFIDRYLDKWDWKGLSKNKALPWSENFIAKYHHRWDWESLSRNEALPWSETLLNKFVDRWWWRDIVRNEKILWYMNCLDRYNASFAYPLPSKWPKDLDWNKNFIKYKIEEWKNWDFLSRNEYLPWSEKLIETYFEKWDWESLSCNEALPWSEDLFLKYIDNWNWSSLSKNKAISWNNGFIDRYIDRWDWFYLCKNEALTWSLSFLEKYFRWINWMGLSQNRALPWKDLLNMDMGYSADKTTGREKDTWFVEFFRKNIDKWDWEGFSMFGETGVFQFSEEIVEKYKDRWDWEKMSNNDSLPWSEAFFGKYIDRWNVESLNQNKVLSLSPKTIIKYRNKWKSGMFQTPSSIYAETFVPFLSEKMIEAVLAQILYP